MQFASPIPWWLAAIIAVGIAGLAYASYRRPLVPLSRTRKLTLVVLRGLSLAALVLVVSRPILLLPPIADGRTVIPVLVDVSRSMRIADVDGRSRIQHARSIIEQTLLPALAGKGTVEILSAGRTPEPATPATLAADGKRSDLASAIESVRDRYRGQPSAGIIVLSDGGSTETAPVPLRANGPAVFTIGIGSIEGIPDREILSMTTGDPRLDETSMDVRVSAASRGFGREPFQLRLLANGRLLESRTVVPVADGSPIDEAFTVFPEPLTATLYTAELSAAARDQVAENDTRSVVANPPGRKRRVLMLAGAPGYDHTFLMRALAPDPGLEVDAVVRKGKDESAADTFLVQASGGRGATLATGFPPTREALFAYDALIVSNLESDFFTRAQLGLAADFVSLRGGGLLVTGSRSFEPRGLRGTALDDVLPLELNDRRGHAVRDPEADEAQARRYQVILTPEGKGHPMMRIGPTPQTSAKLWTTLPALAGSAAVGGPRPGAVVLAVTPSASGGVEPVIAVQRYGRGRSMVFAGEASWRWRMLLPATDRSYEFFWRQAARWLSSQAPDPITLTVPDAGEPGEELRVEAEVRDAGYAPVADARLNGTITAPGASSVAVAFRPTGQGRFAAATSVSAPGLYHLQVRAARASTDLGSADRWFHVGGNEREFADPRLNEGVLRRLARESGGKYVPAAEAATVVSDVLSTASQNATPVRRDLWHEPWAFALVVGLLSAEWILRRRWGLR